MRQEELVRHGMPPMRVVPEGSHVPAGAGTHGMGVSTPRAAAVAEATCGLAMEVHIPHGITFAMGAESWIVAAGAPPISTVC